jgi:hypothetical protein
MKSDDPNFPQEIPPIPEPREELGLPPATASAPGHEDNAVAPESARWTDATDSGNPDDIINDNIDIDPTVEVTAAQGAAFDGNDVDYDEPLDELSGEELTPRVTADRGVGPDAAKPPSNRPGASATNQREAEKPVAANTSFDDWGQSEVPYQPKELGIIDQLLLLLADGAASWRKGLRWVRSQLPPTWQSRLSDEVMTAILLGLLMLLLALWNPLASNKTADSVATNPPPRPIAKTLQSESGVAIANGDPSEISPPEITPLSAITPEQSLIADIQAKVSDLSRAYAAGLIQSVEVDLPDSRLMVNLGENWYGLLPTQQDQISQSIFEQVQQLDFQALLLRDPNGAVVARNPVVGNTMVILHRRPLAEQA